MDIIANFWLPTGISDELVVATILNLADIVVCPRAHHCNGWQCDNLVKAALKHVSNEIAHIHWDFPRFGTDMAALTNDNFIDELGWVSLGVLIIWHRRRLAQKYQCAAPQLGPVPMSTPSGTVSWTTGSAAPAITVRITSLAAATSPSGNSNTSSSCT